MKQYKSLYNIVYVYWRLYGGVDALIWSPYFHVSIVVSFICFPLWWNSDSWAGLALGSVPNLLGFSVGAFAVILSFGQLSLDRLKDKIEAKSRYLGVVVSFVHFIMVQSLALLIALIGKSWGGKIIGFIGTALFAYAIILALAAAMRLFRLARIYNQLADEPPDHKQSS